MSKSDFNSLPYYQDLPRCARCGVPLLEQRRVVNLELEPRYERRLTGKCERCGNGYDFVSKLFGGADYEIYHGYFDSSGAHPTRSGVLTTAGHWDSEKIIRENRATNFKYEVAVQKAREVDNSRLDTFGKSAA